MKRGRLIAFEGLDGSGKSTQLALVGRTLREAGREVVETRERTGGVWGRRIRATAGAGERIAAAEELRSFVEDRREHVAAVIEPGLTLNLLCSAWMRAAVSSASARPASKPPSRRALAKSWHRAANKPWPISRRPQLAVDRTRWLVRRVHLAVPRIVRRFIALADVVNVTLAAGLTTVLLVRLALSARELRAVPFALGLVLGFFAADVASGVLHWFCDTYFDPRTPLLGPMLIAPFREHHVDPTALARHGLLERNGNNCLVCLPLLVTAIWLLEPSLPAHARQHAASGFFGAISLTLCVTNQIHAWAHGARAPRLVCALQQAGVLLAPEHHARHHRSGRAYAVVSGWSNTLLDRVLARTETVLAVLGARPNEPGASG